MRTIQAESELAPHQISRDVSLYTKFLCKWVLSQDFLQGMNSACRLKQGTNKESWRHHGTGGQGDHLGYNDNNIFSNNGEAIYAAIPL